MCRYLTTIVWSMTEWNSLYNTIILRPDKYNKVTEICQDSYTRESYTRDSYTRVKQIKPFTGAKKLFVKEMLFRQKISVIYYMGNP